MTKTCEARTLVWGSALLEPWRENSSALKHRKFMTNMYCISFRFLTRCWQRKPILPPVSISTIYHDSLSLWSTSLCTLLPLPKLWRQWAPGCDHIGSDLHSAFWAFTVYVFCRSFMFNLRCFTSGFSSRYIFLVTVPLVLHHVPSQPNQGFGCRVWCDFGSGCHLSHHGWFVAAVASDSQPITSTCCLWAQLYFFLCILISVFLIFVRGQCAFLGPYCNCAGLDLKHSCYWPTSPVPKNRLFWKRSHMLPSCQRSLPLGKHPSGIALPMWLSWRSATFPQVESDILRRSWRSNIAGLNLLQKKDKNSLFHPSGSNMLLARPPDFFAQRLNLNSPTMPSKSYCPTQKFQVVGFALTTGPERSCCPTLTQSLAECMTLGCFGARTFEIFWSSTSALMLFLGTLGFFVLLVQCRICKWYLWGRNSNAWCRGPATMSQGHHPAQKCPNWHMNGAKHAKHLYAKCVFVCLSV